MRLTPLLIIVSLVISAGLLALMPSPVQAIDPLPDELVGLNGVNLNVNSTDIILNGVNDQTVFYIQFFWLLNGYGQYEYSNHLFRDEGDGYQGDTVTHLHATNYTEFWWKYFYLIHDLGMNCVRLGAFDKVSKDKCMDAYYNHRASWDAVWIPMVEMANLSGTYIIFCFGGTGSSNYDILDPLSSQYSDYTDWYEDVMTEYADEKAIAIWDLFNEGWSNVNNANYWLTHGGYSAYMSWRHDISVNAQANAGSHLVNMDSYQVSWGETSFDASYQDHFDVCDYHAYFSAEDDYLIEDKRDWAIDLGRPTLLGECAINAPITPPYWWYWPWLYAICQLNNVSTIWMTLWAMPGYPVTALNISAIPGIPWPAAPDPPIPPIPDPPTPPSPPIFSISSISSNRTSTYVNMSVQFAVTITGGVPDAPIIWTFDDGSFSMAEDPIHNWSSAGTYHVSLKVNGTSAPNTLTIAVLPVSAPPFPTPTPTPSLGDSLSILGYLLPGVVILVVLGLLVGVFRPGG